MATVIPLNAKKRPKPIKRPIKKASKSRPKKVEGEGFFGRSPLALVVYGPPGVGKTSFAAHFPRPVFIHDPQELGIQILVEYKRVPAPVDMLEVDSFDRLIGTVEEVSEREDCQTVVLDSTTGFQLLCFAHHCEEQYDGDWTKTGFLSFQQGPEGAASTDWPRFIDALNNCRAGGKNIVLLAHSWVKPFNNPEGPDYDRFYPAIHKTIWHVTHRWAQAVLFYNYYSEVRKEGPKNKADQDEDTRYIYTTRSPAHDAKNWMGLEPVIEAGHSGQDAFKAFKKAVLAAGKE